MKDADTDPALPPTWLCSYANCAPNDWVSQPSLRVTVELMSVVEVRFEAGAASHSSPKSGVSENCCDGSCSLLTRGEIGW